MDTKTTHTFQLAGVYAFLLEHSYQHDRAEVPAGSNATPVRPRPMSPDQLEQVLARLEHFMDELMPGSLRTYSFGGDNPSNNEAVQGYLAFTFLGNSFELTLTVWVHPHHDPAFMQALLDNMLITIAGHLLQELTASATEASLMLHEQATRPSLRDMLAGVDGSHILAIHILFGGRQSPFGGGVFSRED